MKRKLPKRVNGRWVERPNRNRYRLETVKGPAQSYDTLQEATEAAMWMNHSIKPAYGVQVVDTHTGDDVYDTEDDLEPLSNGELFLWSVRRK